LASGARVREHHYVPTLASPALVTTTPAALKPGTSTAPCTNRCTPITATAPGIRSSQLADCRAGTSWTVASGARNSEHPGAPSGNGSGAPFHAVAVVPTTPNTRLAGPSGIAVSRSWNDWPMRGVLPATAASAGTPNGPAQPLPSCANVAVDLGSSRNAVTAD